MPVDQCALWQVKGVLHETHAAATAVVGLGYMGMPGMPDCCPNPNKSKGLESCP